MSTTQLFCLKELDNETWWCSDGCGTTPFPEMAMTFDDTSQAYRVSLLLVKTYGIGTEIKKWNYTIEDTYRVYADIKATGKNIYAFKTVDD